MQKHIDFDNITDETIRDIFLDLEMEEQYANDTEINENECVNCNSTDLIEDHIQGIRVCGNCGQVKGSIVMNGTSWDEDGGDTSKSMPINQLLPQSSLGTTIAGHYKTRVSTLHSWSAMPYKERSLNMVFKEIQSKCQQGNIYKCIEEDARIIYHKISECKYSDSKKNQIKMANPKYKKVINPDRQIIIRGTNRRGMIAACVFFACRRKGMTRSPREIAELFEIKNTDMTRGCKNLLKIMKYRNMELNTGTSLPEHFVTRFCHEMRIPQQYISQAIQISKNIKKLQIASIHTPFTTATGSILITAELNGLDWVTRKSLAEKFNVSEITITKTIKKLALFKKILINDDLVNQVTEIIKNNNNDQCIPQSVIDRAARFGITIKQEYSDHTVDPSLMKEFTANQVEQERRYQEVCNRFALNHK